MRKIAAFAAALVFSAALAAPAMAFDRNTMLGAPRLSAPVAMGYMRLPFNGAKSHRMPRAGLMLSAPGVYSVARPLVRSAAPGIVDLGVTRRNFRSRGTVTLNVSDHVAWASDPSVLPKGTPHLDLGGGSVSWMVVGVASAAILTGVYVGSTAD